MIRPNPAFAVRPVAVHPAMMMCPAIVPPMMPIGIGAWGPVGVVAAVAYQHALARAVKLAEVANRHARSRRNAFQPSEN